MSTLQSLADEYAKEPAWVRSQDSRREKLFYDALKVDKNLEDYFYGSSDQQGVVDNFFEQLETQRPEITQVRVGEEIRELLDEETERFVAALKEEPSDTPDPNGPGHIDPSRLNYQDLITLLPNVRGLAETGEIKESVLETWKMHGINKYLLEKGITPDDPNYEKDGIRALVGGGAATEAFKTQAKGTAEGFAETLLSILPVLPKSLTPEYDPSIDKTGIKAALDWEPRIPIFNDGVDLGWTNKEERELFTESYDLGKLGGGVATLIVGGVGASIKGTQAAAKATKADAVIAGKDAATIALSRARVPQTIGGEKALTASMQGVAAEARDKFLSEGMKKLSKHAAYKRWVWGTEAALANAVETGTDTQGITSTMLGLEAGSWQSRIGTTAEAVAFVAAIDKAIRGINTAGQRIKPYVKGEKAAEMRRKLAAKIADDYSDIGAIIANPDKLKGMSIRKAFRSIDNGKLAKNLEKAYGVKPSEIEQTVAGEMRHGIKTFKSETDDIDVVTTQELADELPSIERTIRQDQLDAEQSRAQAEQSARVSDFRPADEARQPQLQREAMESFEPSLKARDQARADDLLQALQGNQLRQQTIAEEMFSSQSGGRVTTQPASDEAYFRTGKMDEPVAGDRGDSLMSFRDESVAQRVFREEFDSAIDAKIADVPAQFGFGKNSTKLTNEGSELIQEYMANHWKTMKAMKAQQDWEMKNYSSTDEGNKQFSNLQRNVTRLSNAGKRIKEKFTKSDWATFRAIQKALSDEYDANRNLGITPNLTGNQAIGQLATQVGGGVVAAQQLGDEEDTLAENSAQFLAGFMMPVSGGAAKLGITSSIRHGAKIAGASAKEWFGTGGRLPANIFRAKNAMGGAVRAELNQVQARLDNLNATIKRVHGVKHYSELDDATIEAYNQYLVGAPVKINSIVKKALDPMRMHVDRLSSRIVSELNLPDEVKAIITRQKGAYLHRSYRIHDDPSYEGRVPQEARDNAKTWFMNQLKMTDEEANGAITNLLSTHKGSDMIAGLITSGKSDVLRKRKDLDQPIQELLGVYKDPFVNYQKSVAKMSQLIEQRKLYDEIIKDGYDPSGKGYIHFKPKNEFGHEVEIAGMGHTVKAGETISDIAKQYSVKKKSILKANGNTVPQVGQRLYIPRNVVYTSKPLAEALKTMEDLRYQFGGPAGYMYTQFLRGRAVSQIAKTVYSPLTHVRNVYGGAIMATSQGHLGALGHGGLSTFYLSKKGRDITKMLIKGVRGNAKERLPYQELMRKGIVGTSAHYGDIQKTLEQVNVGQLRSWLDDLQGGKGIASKSMRGIKKAHEFHAALYALEDDFWKVYAYRSELERYAKAMPNASKETLEELALNAVRMTMPNYDFVPKAVQVLRQLPFGNFVAFPAEMIRNTANTFRLAAKEIADPNLRKIGYTRLASFIGVGMLGTSAISMYSKYKNNISEQNDRDVRRLVPEWNKRSQLVYLQGIQDTFRVADLTYLDPFEYIKKPLMTMVGLSKLDDESISQAVLAGAHEFAKPFISESILTRALKEAISNQTSFGSRIVNPQDSWDTKLVKRINHLWKNLEPGYTKQASNIYKAATGIADPPRDLGEELSAFGTGTRVIPISAENSIKYKWGGPGGVVNAIRENSRQFTEVANSYKKPSPTQITEAYITSNKNRFKNMQEAYRDIVALRRTFKVSDKVIYQMLTSQGFTKKDSMHILSGVFPASILSKQARLNAHKRGNIIDVPAITDVFKSINKKSLADSWAD